MIMNKLIFISYEAYDKAIFQTKLELPRYLLRQLVYSKVLFTS